MFKKVSNVEDITDMLLLPMKLKLLDEWEKEFSDMLVISHHDLSNVPEEDQIGTLMNRESKQIDISIVLLAMLRGHRIKKCLTNLDNVIFLNSTFPAFYDSMSSLQSQS